MRPDEPTYRPDAITLPAHVLVRRLGTVSLPTELVVRFRAVDREHIGSTGIDTPRHLDVLEADVRAGSIRVPLVLALTQSHGFLDGNHRLAVALRLRLTEVPVDVWTAPEDLRTEYGRPLTDDDLNVILDRLRLAALPTSGSAAGPEPGNE